MEKGCPMPMPRNPDRIRGMAKELELREQTEQAIARKPPPWGYCPVCKKERKVRPTSRKLRPHRRFVRKAVPDAYGEMIPCDGEGLYPLR